MTNWIQLTRMNTDLSDLRQDISDLKQNYKAGVRT